MTIPRILATPRRSDPRARPPAVVLLGALTLAATGLSGTAAADQETFDRFVGSADHLSRAAAAALAADAAMPPACGDRAVGERLAVAPQAAPRFDDGPAQPTGGAWWERWQVERCGETRTLNLHFVADRAGISVDVGVPGETRAQPLLQQGAVDVLAPFAGDTLAACADFAVVNSRVTVPPADGGPTAAWTERWTLLGCGREGDVTIRFHPDQAPSLFEIVADDS